MSAYSDLVLSHGASAYWRLNEPSGTTAADSAGTRTGTLAGTGTVLGVTGRLAGELAASFDGNGRFLPASMPSLGTAFTLEAWVNPTAYPVNTFGILVRQVFSDGDFQWQYRGTTIVRLFYQAPTPVNYDTVAVLPLGSWTHLAVTGTAGQAVLYINGVAQPGLAITFAGAGGGPGAIGGFAEAGAETYGWKGALQDVAMYPTALSAAQILNHYTVGTTVESVPSAGCDHTTVWSTHLATRSAPTVESERAYLATLYGEPGGTDFSTLVSRWLDAISCGGASMDAPSPETVQTGTASAASADTLTLTFPGATGNGRGIVVGVISSSSSALPAGACSDNKGNTYTRILSQAGTANSLAVYLCPKGVGGPTHTVTIAPALGPVELLATALEVRGVGAGLALDASGSTTGTSSTPAIASGAVTTTGILALALAGLDAAQSSLVVSTTDGQTGWSELAEDLA